MNAIFQGKTITTEGIDKAIDEFDLLYPDSNSYDNGWLDKENYKYAIEKRGKYFPCKCILRLAIDDEMAMFHGGDESNRVLRELGFNVVNKS